MSALFISYASDDQAVALEVCAQLEAQGVGCWIAPRDVAPGAQWDEAIVDAITSAGAFLLVLTTAANGSPYVKNEVNHAFAAKLPIFTFRVEDVQPDKSLGFYLARHHWTDGFPAPMAPKLAQLSAAVMTVLGAGAASLGTITPAARPARRSLATRLAGAFRARRTLLTGSALGFLAASALAIAVGVSLRGAPVNAPEMRLQIVLPPLARLTSFALSPDGHSLVFQADGKLWLRSLASEEATPLAGTEQSLNESLLPFWSPDSQSVAFFVDNRLKRIDLASGVVRTVAGLPGASGRGGTWSAAGTIVFAPSSDGSPLFRVSADGGETTPVTRLEAGHRTHRYPQFLPDGRRFIFFARTTDSQGLYLGSVDSLETRRLLDSDGSAVFAAPDAVLFGRKEALLAQRFNLADMTPRGNPISIAGQVAVDWTTPNTSLAGSLAVSASANGMLAYRLSAGRNQYVLMDRAGREIGSLGEALATRVGVSPDQRTLAMARTINGNTDVWLVDVAGVQPSRRFTTSAAWEAPGAWSPDGRHLVFTSSRKGVLDLYIKSIDGNDERPLLESANGKAASDWSADGRFLLYQDAAPTTADDLWALPMSGDRKPFAVVQTPALECCGRFSPDGRWISFISQETGRSEAYVQAFPGPAERVRISTDGAGTPFWSADGRELYFPAPGGRLMAVPIAGGGTTLKPGTPVALFQTAAATSPAAFRIGERFLAVSSLEAPSPLTIVLNWKPPIP